MRLSPDQKVGFDAIVFVRAYLFKTDGSPEMPFVEREEFYDDGCLDELLREGFVDSDAAGLRPSPLAYEAYFMDRSIDAIRHVLEKSGGVVRRNDAYSPVSSLVVPLVQESWLEPLGNLGRYRVTGEGACGFERARTLFGSSE